MKIILYQSSDDFNVVNKSLLNPLEILNYNIKFNTSILNPTIELSSINIYDIQNYNYTYIEEFNRYYFISNIVSMTSKKVELTLNVDVLMSFKNEILKQEHNIVRQENKYNSNIVDSNYIENVEVLREIVKFENTPLNISNATTNDNNYVLIVAGGGNIVT